MKPNFCFLPIVVANVIIWLKEWADEILVDLAKHADTAVGDEVSDDDVDFVAFIRYAARLAALGDISYIIKVPGLFKDSRFIGREAEIIRLGIDMLEDDIYNHEGGDLAVSVVDVQDLKFFFKIFPQYLDLPSPTKCWGDSPLRIFWNQLEERANLVGLNREAKDGLICYKAKYPVPQCELLEVIQNPQTDAEIDERIRVYNLTRPKPIRVTQRKDGSIVLPHPDGEVRVKILNDEATLVFEGPAQPKWIVRGAPCNVRFHYHSFFKNYDNIHGIYNAVVKDGCFIYGKTLRIMFPNDVRIWVRLR
jgi:hypothetical protein